MTGRRILVTGMSGFAGAHVARVARRLLPNDVLDQLGCDLADADAIEERVRDLRPDACLHLAAVAAIGVARAEPERAWSINLGGTLALARAMHEHVPDAPLLFVSSADAYGGSFRAGVALDETAALAPLNTYAATKAAADLALGAMAAEGQRVIRLRAFNHAGPGQSDDFAIPAFARQIALIRAGRQEPVLRVGNLDAARDFLDVRDVAAAYALCLARADAIAPGTILNIASGVPRRIGDVLDALLSRAGVAVRIEHDPVRARPSDIPVAIGDASRLRALGWEPAIDWNSTLDDVIQDWDHRVADGA
jgi:GDP-4-dehydro-6-deoxy-D-mannose reductase